MSRRKEAHTLRPLAEAALIARFRDLRPELFRDGDKRLANLRPLVLDTVSDASLEMALRDIAKGDGRELAWDLRRSLPPDLHSLYSSCGLALNTFGPWRLDPSAAHLLAMTGFTELRFEQKLPVFSRGGRAPNLDAVFSNDEFVLAIESKLCEHLAPAKPAEFQASYDTPIALAHESWRNLYHELRARPNTFAWLGVGQLIRHYLGVSTQIKAGGMHAGKSATLAYVYWEPDDADQHDACIAHRDELTTLTSQVSDPDVTFAVLPLAELLREWETERNAEPWLATHVSLLRKRYGVRLRASTREMP